MTDTTALAALASARAANYPPAAQAAATPASDPTLRDLWRGIVKRYELAFTARATTYAVIFAIGLALGGRMSAPAPKACQPAKIVKAIAADPHHLFTDAAEAQRSADNAKAAGKHVNVLRRAWSKECREQPNVWVHV